MIVHGTDPAYGTPTEFFVNELRTHPQQIADAILGNPAYKGGPVNLVTCFGNCGPAQALQEILGVEVKSADGFARISPKTNTLQSSPTTTWPSEE